VDCVVDSPYLPGNGGIVRVAALSHGRSRHLATGLEEVTLIAPFYERCLSRGAAQAISSVRRRLSVSTSFVPAGRSTPSPLARRRGGPPAGAAGVVLVAGGRGSVLGAGP
jgi:hypothetical protein